MPMAHGDDRVALVTGGTGLIGTAVTRRLVGAGLRVVAAARTQSRLDEEVAAFGDSRVRAVTVDVASTASVRQAVSAAARCWGRLDVVVNAAGPPAAALTGVEDVDDVLAAVDAKAFGSLRVARAAWPYVSRSGAGRVVNVGGQLAHLTGSVAAAVRNQAVDVISKALADEFAPSGVTVNVVHPGPVVAGDPPPVEAVVGRPGTTSADRVAALVGFLVSVEAGSISGASIDVGHSLWGFVR